MDNLPPLPDGATLDSSPLPSLPSGATLDAPVSRPKPQTDPIAAFDAAQVANVPKPKPSVLTDLGQSALGAAQTGLGEVVKGFGDVGRKIDESGYVPDFLKTPGLDKSTQDVGAGLAESGRLKQQYDVSPEFAKKTSMGITDPGGFTATNIANKAINTVAGMAPAMAAYAIPGIGPVAGTAAFAAQGEAGGREAGEQQVANLTDEQIQQVPRYQELVQSGLDPTAARKQLSDEVANRQATVQGIFGGALGVAGKIPGVEALGSMAGKAIVRPAAKVLGSSIARPVARVIGKGAAEAASFGGINAGGQVLGNVTNQVPTPTFEGVPEAAASGLAPGFVMGAAHGIGTQWSMRRPVPYPTAKPGSMADAANAVHESGGTVNRSQPTVEQPPAPNPVPEAAQPAPEQASTPAPNRAEPAVEQNVPQAPSVPWINAETGEIRPATDDEIKHQFQRMFDAAQASGASMQTTAASKMLADQWGIPKSRLVALRKDALADRKEGMTTDQAAQAAADSLRFATDTQAAHDEIRAQPPTEEPAKPAEPEETTHAEPTTQEPPRTEEEHPAEPEAVASAEPVRDDAVRRTEPVESQPVEAAAEPVDESPQAIEHQAQPVEETPPAPPEAERDADTSMIEADRKAHAERMAELEKRVGNLSDDQAVAAVHAIDPELGFNLSHVEPKQLLLDQHPDDIESALSKITTPAEKPTDEPVKPAAETAANPDANRGLENRGDRGVDQVAPVAVEGEARPAPVEPAPTVASEPVKANEPVEPIATKPPETKVAAQKKAEAATAPPENEPGQPLHPWTPVDTSKAVAYAGGVSTDGRRIHLDPNMPKTVQVEGKTIDAHDAVAYHESIEFPLMHLSGKMTRQQIRGVRERAGGGKHGEIPKSSLDKLARGESLTYPEAHHIATLSENHRIRTLYGVDPEKYQAALKDGIDAARAKAEPAQHPADLDAKPYVDMGEEHLLTTGKEAPERESTSPAAPDRSIVKVRTVYGDTHRVRADHLADQSRTMLPTFDTKGNRKIGGPLHRGNIADEATIKAKNNDVNYIVRAGKDRDLPFKNENAVKIRIKKLGQNPEDFEIVRVPGGFVGKRKGATRMYGGEGQRTPEKSIEPAKREAADHATIGKDDATAARKKLTGSEIDVVAARERAAKSKATAWDSMDYSQREKLAQEAYGSMRRVVHRIAMSKWERLSDGERESVAKRMGGGVDEHAAQLKPPKASTPSARVADWVTSQLESGKKFTSRDLFVRANDEFGGTQSEGKYTPKDAYDALELGVNKYIIAHPELSPGGDTDPQAALAKLRDLTDLLPTQTKRTQEQDEFQQFSTVPTFAYVANWVANLRAGDHVLEPSAGIGGLAAFAKRAGADVTVNELSPRRADVLRELGFPTHTENAEQLHNVLPESVKPDVVVMNPPFSATAGRVAGQRKTINGAVHIEQALKRLEPGGRLVAIVGEGMAADKPRFAKWWDKIKAEYNVRANVGLPGAEYAKYGTTFDNQLLVIDKTGPSTGSTLTGKVATIADAPALLRGIRDDRTANSVRQGEQPTAEPAGTATVAPSTPGAAEPRPVPDSTGAVGTGSGEAGPAPTGPDSIDAGRGEPVEVARGVDEVADRGKRGRRGNTPAGRRADQPDAGAGGGTPTKPPVADDATVEVAPAPGDKGVVASPDADVAGYKPAKLKFPGAKPHPGKLVESAAMGAVQFPDATYKPNLPKSIVTEGKLSDAQLETIVYAGQAHSQDLPDGSRRGFFVGDGTGVGKGREISGVILDNMRQGKGKHVWISEKSGLLADAKRDFSGIGGDAGKIFAHSKTKASDDIKAKDGVLFTTYATLRSGEKKGAKETDTAKPKTRLQQIVDWLGKDFDGVIAFDEAHNMGNALAMKGKRGVQKASEQALAGVELQRLLPRAKVLYVSATGATEVSNLSYATRLGLWGEKTAFASPRAFVDEINKGGLAAMELVSRDMKQQGAYTARNLSYDGVTYSRLEHKLTPFQTDVYNELAKAWQGVLQNVHAALKLTGAVGDKDSGGGPTNANAKSAALSAFWSSQQRFFNQVITAMQMPTVIEQARRDLDAGHSVVMQLVNTNEAIQNRQIAARGGEGETRGDLEDLDLTPRENLIQYVKNSFPVAQYETRTDENGNPQSVPVLDSSGAPVFNREAIAKRDALIKTLENIRVPDGPLEMLLNEFGPDAVAEVTGRGQRVVRVRQDDGTTKTVLEKRHAGAARADADAFQAGKKRLLVFSDAGGTGFSFHADKTADNQQRRMHYLVQPGWRADKAVQGFGRTHRSNQASAPHYYLPTTDLPAQKRFISSIARRLDQLGALTKGQRDAGSQGLMSAKDNLESEYAARAIERYVRDLFHDRVSGESFGDTTKALGFDSLVDKDGTLNETKIPDVPQFLNRLLSLTTDQQGKVFEQFSSRLDAQIEQAIQDGTLDTGMQTLNADSIRKVGEQTVYTDPRTGAETKYVELELTQPTQINPLPTSDAFTRYTFYRNKQSGRVWAVRDAGTRTKENGEVVERVSMTNPTSRHITDKTHIGDNFEMLSDAKAAAAWQAETDAAPKTYTEPAHIVTGALLPIWDRLQGDVRVVRAVTKGGEQYLGRYINKRDLAETLKRLGANNSASNMKAPEVMDAVMSGKPVELVNGWRLERKRVSDENRIEITRANMWQPAVQTELKRAGAYVERIDWQERAFVPKGEAGHEVLQRILDSRPVAGVMDGEGGNFRLGDESNPGAAATDDHTAKIDAAVRTARAQWGKNAPDVRVARSVEELPQAAKDSKDYDYKRARGYVGKDGTIYVVAGKHASAADALRTVAHEAVGHYGVDRIIEDHVKGGWDTTVKAIDRLRNDRSLGSKSFRDVLDEVERRYTKQDGTRADPKTYAKEVLAVAAERGLRNGLVARAIAAVRAWLRKTFPNLKYNDKDILSLLTHSEGYLRGGAAEGARNMRPALRGAFDQAEHAGLTEAQARNPAILADAARKWKEMGTDSPYFRRWFGNSVNESKVVSEDGTPRVVYHGTADDFDEFKAEHAGSSTGHMTTPLGHFFDESHAQAEVYAKNASDGVPMYERVVAAYLNIKNPARMTLDKFLSIQSKDEARAVRAKLEAQGHDGIELQVRGRKQWIAFDSSQIKSVDNKGTFSEGRNIKFSLDDPAEERRNALRDMQAQPVSSSLAHLTGEKLRAAALAEFNKAREQGPIRMTDGADVNLTKAGFKEAQSHSADRRVLDIMPDIRTLMEKAVPLWQEAAHDPDRPNLKAFRNYGVKVAGKNGDYFARFVVRVGKDGRFHYDHDATSVEALHDEGPSHQPDRHPKPGEDAAGLAKNRLAQWWNSVKPKDTKRGTTGDVATDKNVAGKQGQRAAGGESRREAFKRGDKLGEGYVFHNLNAESLTSIEREGMDSGSFSRSPIKFGGDRWIAVKESDLPGFQEHSYGAARALEPNWERVNYDENMNKVLSRNSIDPSKIIEVDSKGRYVRRLNESTAPDSSGANHPENPEGSFSLDDDRVVDPSRPTASIDHLGETFAKPDNEGVFDAAKQWLRGKWEDFRPVALGALTRRQIGELIDSHPALKGFGKMYDERVQKMEAERHQMIAGAPDAAEHPQDMLKKGAAPIADAVRKFAYQKGVGGWLGRKNPEAKALADVMHMATIHGVDPSEEYQRLQMEDSTGKFFPWTPQAVKERITALRAQMRGRPGDDKRAMMDEVKALRALKYREAARTRVWPDLKAAYQKLSPEAKELYRMQRDWYAQIRDENEKAMLARIDAIGRDLGGLTGDDLRRQYLMQAKQRIRLQFESLRREGVYFPLNRDGDFFIAYSDKNGAQGFNMFEDAKSAATAERKLRADGFKIDVVGRRDGNYKAKSAPPGTFVADVIGIMKKSGAPEKAQDEVYQAFLRTLPEMSMRKHSIHRKKVPGYSEDILRNFSKNAFHGAFQLARLRNAHELTGILDGARASMDNYRRAEFGSDRSAPGLMDVAKGDALLGELGRRHDYMMSPTDAQLANHLNAIGFIYHIGASPATAIVNLTQNAQTTFPVLGGQHGFAKAARVLGAALRDSMRTGGNIQRTLTREDERRAHAVLEARGDITKTQAHTLAALAEGNQLKGHPAWSKFMGAMTYMFHKVEVVNRESAGMAAYRLARMRGDDFDTAVQYASDIINGTHFDYTSANRARYMQGNAGRIIFQFKNWSQQMTWMMYRNLYQAFRGETPEVRRAALRTFAGIMGTTALMAGTMGLPMYNAVKYTAEAADSLFGDGEPFDFDTEYQKWLGDNLGTTAGKYLARGAANQLTGAALSTRTSLSDLFFRDADRNLQGKDAYYDYIDGLAGPIGGITKNLFIGTKQIADGYMERGIETLLPNFVKNPIKALRYETQGANTLRGDPIVEDVSSPEAFVQMLGFQPTRIFEQQRENSALLNASQQITDQRIRAMNAYALAVRAGQDTDLAMERIHDFNRKYPEVAINSNSIRQSLRARARYSAEAQGGVAINRKLSNRLRDSVGVEQAAAQ